MDNLKHGDIITYTNNGIPVREKVMGVADEVVFTVILLPSGGQSGLRTPQLASDLEAWGAKKEQAHA